MSVESAPILLSALLLGFVGSGHCLAMCGGIAGALGQVKSATVGPSPLVSSLLYSFGRILSYSLFGAVAGLFGSAIGSALGVGPLLRSSTGLVIVAFGLSALGFGFRLAWLERIGFQVWRRVSPIVARVGNPDRIWKRVLLGALWGWLPCGMVYAALAAASMTGNGITGAMFMFAFGLGTMPALVVAASAAAQLGVLLQRRAARHAVGFLLVGFGCWTIYSAFGLGPGHEGADHHGSPIHDQLQGSSPDVCAIAQEYAKSPRRVRHKCV